MAKKTKKTKKPTELWGLRDLARHYGVSWRLVRKWADPRVGLIPLVAEPQQLPVTKHGIRAKKGPDGKPVRDMFGFAEKERFEVTKPVWKMFDTAVVRIDDPEKREAHVVGLRKKYDLICKTQPELVKELGR